MKIRNILKEKLEISFFLNYKIESSTIRAENAFKKIMKQ